MNVDSKNQIEIIDAELIGGVDPKPALLERLLSQQSLQWMMAAGAGLLVIGFAVWLWSVGVFENPLVLATAVGGASLSLVGLGIWLLLSTRHHLAGRGLTLLGSLILPLNLWLYDSQGLITLAEGGPLWLPALLCCVIYAAVARLTRDSIFVYTLVGGIALTGTLFLAGAPGNLFWSLIPIAVFMVSLGITCISADSWFLDTGTPFSRDKFGKAFFNAGHAALLIGIAVLAAGQFGDFLRDVVSRTFSTPEAMKVVGGKFCVLGVLIAASLAYFYCGVTRRKNVVFNLMGVLIGAWAVVQTAVVFQIHITLDAGLVALAAFLIGINLIRSFIYRKGELTDGCSMAIGMSALSLMTYVIVQYVSTASGFFAGWINVAQAVLAASILITLPRFWDTKNSSVANPMLFASSAAIAFAMIAAVYGLGFTQVAYLAAIATVMVLLLAIITLVTSFSFDDKVSMVANAMTCVALVFWVGSIFVTGVGFTSTVSIAIAMLSLINCGILTFKSCDRLSIVTGAVCSKIFVAQMVLLFDLTNGYAIVIAIMLVGLALVIAARMMAKANSKFEAQQTVHHAGNGLVCVAAIGASLFALTALAAGGAAFSHLALVLIQLVSLGIATTCTKDIGWRRGFLVSAITIVGTAIALVINLSTLTIFQRVEIFSIAVGIFMVALGYIGWSRESKGFKSDAVSFNLIVGSWVLVAPFVVGIIGDRMAESTVDAWRYIHEIGGLTVALALLGSGILCRVRSTTISGGTLLSVFVASVVLLINIPDQLQQTSVLMMIGGGLFFATSILLSVYRENLMKLPEKIRSGKGVFQILKWR